MGGFAFLVLMLSGAARPDAPLAPDVPLAGDKQYPIQIISIEGPCAQTLEPVFLPPNTLLAFSFPKEFSPSDFSAVLSLSGAGFSTFSIPLSPASAQMLNLFFPLSTGALLIADSLIPPGDYQAVLRVKWGLAAVCPISQISFRLATITGNPATITGNPADSSILPIAEVPTVEDSASSGRGSAAEGAARVGCALNPHTSSSTSSLVWFFLCVVLLGLSLVSIRARSSPAGRLGSSADKRRLDS